MYLRIGQLRKIRGKGELRWDLCTQKRECLLDYSWFLRLGEPSKKEKQKEEQWKPEFLSEPRSILFFFQDHVPGIMLREFKVVMHVFWDDHYQGAGRTPTRSFISWISFSFVKCEPCMTEHTRMIQDFNTLIQWTIVMWPLPVKFSIIMVENYNR